MSVYYESSVSAAPILVRSECNSLNKIVVWRFLELLLFFKSALIHRSNLALVLVSCDLVAERLVSCNILCCQRLHGMLLLNGVEGWKQFPRLKRRLSLLARSLVLFKTLLELLTSLGRGPNKVRQMLWRCQPIRVLPLVLVHHLVSQSVLLTVPQLASISQMVQSRIGALITELGGAH